MRLAKILTVAIILAGTIFGSFGQFFVAQKVKAAEISPPSPIPGILTFKYTATGNNTDRRQIIMKYTVGGAVKEYSFVYQKEVLTRGKPNSDLSRKFSASVINRFNTGGLVSAYHAYTYSTDSKYTLVVADKLVNDTYNGLYNVAGIFSPGTGATEYVFTNFHAVAGDDDSADLGSLIYTNYVGTGINYSTSNADLCSNMLSTWAQVSEKWKLLLAKKPAENPTYWYNKGIDESTERIINGAVFSQAFRAGPLVAALAFGASQWYTQAWDDSAKGYALTDAGNREATAMKTLLLDLPTIANSIKSANSNVWPANCKPGKFMQDGSVSTTEFYSTPADFLSVVGTLAAIFDNAASGAAAEDDDNDGKCGKLFGFGNNAADMFNTLGCYFADIVHQIARAIMTKAAIYLESSIGIESIKIQGPAPETDVTTGAGTGTGSEVPSVTGALNSRVEINMSSKPADYATLKAAGASGVWAKVKKSTGAGSILDITVSEVTFEDSTKKLKAKFVTTQALPADWTTIRVYGGKTGQADPALFKFNTTKPTETGSTITATTE